ncbi:cupin domain-containing protein [Sphingomonas sp. RB1R13]|uniref:cupin domain-containing protein n=1 Tax=Sphingomonas sp. RB1R13 TaxID=3096159 RepID=UPI002FC61D4E
MTELPDEGTLVVRARAEWTPDQLPGVSTQSLIDDPRGYRTVLMKIEPSPFGVLHAHDEIEQIYVIKGDFFDDEKSYGPGDFIVRAPGALHRTGSKNGAITLLIYAPPAAPRT